MRDCRGIPGFQASFNSRYVARRESSFCVDDDISVPPRFPWLHISVSPSIIRRARRRRYLPTSLSCYFEFRKNAFEMARPDWRREFFSDHCKHDRCESWPDLPRVFVLELLYPSFIFLRLDLMKMKCKIFLHLESRWILFIIINQSLRAG